MIIIRFGWLMAVFAFFSCHPPAQAQNNLVLVSEGNPNATIVISASAPKYILEAATDLQWHIKLSTGTTLPIVSDAQSAGIPTGQVKLAVGASNITEGKISAKELDFEEFAIKTDFGSKTIMMVANDGPENPATHWAVCELLERTMGAKWLWPGELGTFVEKKSTLTTPGINVQWISPYDFRMFRKNAPAEVRNWMIHHRIASRREFQENSNNRDWHEKYYNKYPEIFARTPDGSPYNNKWASKYPKFRLDNPKYFELMIEDYNSKGKPAVYTLYPNDGGLFDSKMIPGQDPKKVFYGEVPVTKAYLDFYSKFDKQVNGDRAVTRFDILAYSAYYLFPDNYTFDGKNFNLWYVDRTNDHENWKKWQATGAKMYLRPNWWNRSSFGPDITYKKNGEMLAFAQKNGMTGFKIDGFKDNWSLQGLNYYVMARQLYTSKTIEDLAAEYMAAFGAAAPEIKEYFALCMANSDGFNKDLLSSITEDLDLDDNANFTSVEAIPGIFPESFRTKLKGILDKADQKTSGTENARVEWLKSGLMVTDIISNYVTEALKNPEQPPNTEILAKKVKEIEAKYPYSITAKSFNAVMKRKFKPQNKGTKKN